MTAALKLPPSDLSVPDFLAWSATTSGRWELVDGALRAMAPASRTHGALQNEIGLLLGLHLRGQGGRCSVITAPGIVPRVNASTNVRIPDLAVTCSDYQEEEEATLADPVLIIELLSPSNKAETWSNVWTYTTIPSVREILILRTAEIGGDLLRRNPDGTWPDKPQSLDEGPFVLESIDFRGELSAFYRTTRLVRG